MGVSGIVYGGSGVDRHSGLLQCCRPDHVPFLDASAGAFDVPAGAAGRHGAGQRDLGRTGRAAGSNGGTGMVRRCTDPRTVSDPAASPDRGRIADGSRCRTRLMNRSRGRMKKILALIACGFLMIAAAEAQAAQPKPEHRTVTELLQNNITNMQQEFVPAAEAMPEDNYGL